MSRLSELHKIDALEIVPKLNKDDKFGWNPFEGIKISAYRSEEVDKLVTDMEGEISELKTKLRERSSK